MHLHEQPELDTKSILERKMEKKKHKKKRKKNIGWGFQDHSGVYLKDMKSCIIPAFKLETCVCKTLCTQLYAYH